MIAVDLTIEPKLQSFARVFKIVKNCQLKMDLVAASNSPTSSGQAAFFDTDNALASPPDRHVPMQSLPMIGVSFSHLVYQLSTFIIDFCRVVPEKAEVAVLLLLRLDE